MVTRKDYYVFGIISLYELEVLVDSVCCSLIPIRSVLALIRRKYFHTSVSSVKIPRQTVSYIFVEHKRLVLCQYTNCINSRIDAVGQREVNYPVLSAKGHCRLGILLRKSIQTASLSACKQHCDAFFVPKHDILLKV